MYQQRQSRTLFQRKIRNPIPELVLLCFKNENWALSASEVRCHPISSSSSARPLHTPSCAHARGARPFQKVAYLYEYQARVPYCNVPSRLDNQI